MKSRTQTLLLFGLIVALLLRIGLPWLTEPIELRQRQLRASQQRINDLDGQLALAMTYTKAIRDAGQSSLHPDPTTASIRYQEWLRNQCESLGLANPKISLKEPVAMPELGSGITVALALSGPLEPIGNLIDVLTSAKINHRIKSLRLNGFDPISGFWRCALELEGLAMLDNPTFDPLVLSREVELHGLGSFLAKNGLFELQQPHANAQAELMLEADDEQPVFAETPRPIGPDSLASIRLIGVVTYESETYALFHDALNQIDFRVSSSGEVNVAGFQAKALRIDRDGILLAKDQVEFTVMLGQSLRESLEEQLSSRIR